MVSLKAEITLTVYSITSDSKRLFDGKFLRFVWNAY